jgi:DNA repair exonuclease SbcCD nuclease subunit
MATYGLFSDPHLTRRPPVSCTESYLPDMLDLIRQAFAVFTERGVTAGIIAGDTFHAKAPSRTDHALVREIAHIVRPLPFPVWALPGNHDMQFDKIDSLAGQPLGVLYETGVLHCLDGWMGGEHPVFGVPWQQHWSEDGIAECLEPWAEQATERSLVVTHAPIYPPSSEPRYEGAELTPADWWAHALRDLSQTHSVFYGHIHESHGTWRRAGVTFCNNGALSRGSLGEDNLTRQVGVTLWDSGTGEFEFVPLDAKPASQVFRLSQHEQDVTAQMSLDRFLGGLSETVLPRLDPATVLEQFRAQPGVGPEDLALAAELLEWSEHEGAKR